MQFLIFVVFAGAMYWFYYNFLLGYRKKNITLTFDDRFYSLDEHVAAIEQKLATEGHSARYLGDRRFEVDGKPYLFLERTVPVGGAPTQQTILEQQKKKLSRVWESFFVRPESGRGDVVVATNDTSA